MKIGIFLPSWIGDVVMATPTLRALAKHRGPDGTLTAILKPYVRDVLAGTSWIDEYILYDHRADDANVRNWRVLQQLRSQQFDALVLLSNSLRIAAMAWLGGGRRRVGYVRNGRGPLLTDKLLPPRSGRKLTPISAVDYYLATAYQLGCPVESKQLELQTTPESEVNADAVWRKYGIQQDEPVVVFGLGGATSPARHWPTEYWTGLAQRIARQLDARVMVACGPAEVGVARTIVAESADRRVFTLADESLSIGLAKACFRRSRLAVAADSGPRHMAAAFNVPTVTLFGPTDPLWTINYNPNEVYLREPLDCAPCGQKTCPLEHHACLRDLTVERVFQAVGKLLPAPNEKRVA